jgi:hypothetical protein
MSDNSGLNAAMTVLAISNAARASAEAARADEAEENLSNIIDTEAESLGTVISKKALFRETADEMTRDLKTKLSRGLTSDIEEIKVRKGLFSLFSTAVPHDVLQKAKTEGQEMLDDVVEEALSPMETDHEDIARDGVRDEELEPYFESGRGVEFLEGLDDEEVQAIARLGVINTVQYALNELDVYNYERGESETRQQFRAGAYALGVAADKAYDICEELKAPYEKKVIASGPAPQA